MISFSSAQLDAWMAAYLFPLARILALLAVAPPFNHTALPARVKAALGIAICVALVPTLPPQAVIAPGSWTGLLVLAQQMLIGIALGFVLRITFAAVELAGEVVSMQMGLGFAVMYDPAQASQSSVLTQFLGLIALLLFLAMNGHLLMLHALAQGFTLLPVSGLPVSAKGWQSLVRFAATLFATGVMLSLPLIAALLLTNVALAVLTRAAPTLNLFSLGFPITLATGFGVLALSLSYMAPLLERAFDNALDTLGRWHSLAAPLNTGLIGP